MLRADLRNNRGGGGESIKKTTGWLVNEPGLLVLACWLGRVARPTIPPEAGWHSSPPIELIEPRNYSDYVIHVAT